MKTNASRLIGVAVLVIVISATVPICLAGAGDDQNPGIVPIQAHYDGHTYSEWLATFWQWSLGLPCPENPNFCGTGTLSDGQPMHLWFLPSIFTAGAPAAKTIQATVPAGKALFVLLYSWEQDNFLCVSPPTSYSPQELQQIAVSDGIEAVEYLEADVDGVQVKDPKQYAAVTSSFDILLPPDNVISTCLGCTMNASGGIIGPAFASGYSLILEPPPVGKHVVHLHVTILPSLVSIVGTSSWDLTYDVTVVPESH